MALDIRELSSTMLEAAGGVLGDRLPDVLDVTLPELESIAGNLVRIEKLRIEGPISESQAQRQVRMQQRTAQSVLLTKTGLSALAVEEAINAALEAVAGTVNSAVGFKVL